jgi:hypothetical protein
MFSVNEDTIAPPFLGGAEKNAYWRGVACVYVVRTGLCLLITPLAQRRCNPGCVLGGVGVNWHHCCHEQMVPAPAIARWGGTVPGVSELQQDTERRAAYLEWLTTPLEEREIKSERQLAMHLNTSRANLHRWKNDWRFAAKVQERLSRNLDIGVVPDILASLLVSAKDPDSPRQVTAANAILGYVKWNLERAEELNVDVRNLSDDELRDLMLQALDTIDERERITQSH